MTEQTLQTFPTKVKHTLELGENAFWATVWTLVAITLTAIFYLALSFGSKSDAMVAASVDPVATACALGTHSTVSNQCTALLARGK